VGVVGVITLKDGIEGLNRATGTCSWRTLNEACKDAKEDVDPAAFVIGEVGVIGVTLG
jgi:hypothetical protein